MKNKFFIIFLIWFLVISGFLIYNEGILRTGNEVLLKTVPIDPRNLLRGDYVILNYEISNNEAFEDYERNEIIYIKLKTDKKNIATIDDVSYEKPNSEIFIKGKKKRRAVEYGIESYFVKEGTGRKLEKKLRSGAYVRVSIDKNGNAKIKELVLD